MAGTDAAHFYLLFPNAIDRDNRIEADKVIELPRKGWQITAGGPAGAQAVHSTANPIRAAQAKTGTVLQDEA
jgi:hypothetical protein